MKKLFGLLLILALGFFSVPAGAEEPAAQRVKVTTLQVAGMIPGSAPKVEAILRGIPGVTQVKANEDMKAAVIIYDPLKVKQEEFLPVLHKAGYLASFAKANYRCPQCKANYSKDGICILCNVPLERAA